MNVIEEIHRKLPNTHLVMHGSSSVPQDLQDVFNAVGGEMPQTWGVPVEEIVRGIKHGVRKVNIDTDCRMAMTGAIPQGRDGEQGRIRSAQVPEARDGRDAEALQASASSSSAPPARPRRSRSSRWPKWPSAIRRARSIRRSPPRAPPEQRQRRSCEHSSQPEADRPHRRGRQEDARHHDEGGKERYKSGVIPIREDGLLGARLRAQGHRRPRALPHHAAGRASIRSRRRRPSPANRRPRPGRWCGPTG